MNDQDRDPQTSNESGGLFSDDYTEVKRENPYLRKKKDKPAPEPKPEKPQKSRPVKPEKTAVSAPDRVSFGSPVHDSIASATESPRKRKTLADFYFEHVKLITAVVTIILVLSLVVITDVVGFVQDFAERQEQKDKIPLTMAHVEALAEKSEPVTWSDMARYARFNISTGEDSVTWYFEVQGTDFEVWISGVSTAKPPTYVQLRNLMTGEYMDLNKDNFDLFMSGKLSKD